MTLAVALCGALALVGVTIPQRAGAAPAGETAAKWQIEVRVEVKLGDEDDERFASALKDAVVREATGEQFAVVDRAGTSLLVAVGWTDASRSDLELRYFVTRNPGDPERLGRTVCSACGSSEAIARIDEDLASLSAWASLRKSADPVTPAATGTAAPAGTAATSGTTTATPSTPPTADAPTRDRTLGRMGIAGASVLAVGGTMLGFGATVWAVRFGHPHRDTSKTRDYQPVGIPMVAVGAAAVVTGVVLLAVDLRKHARARKLALAPHVDGRGVGLALAGRF
ncbi:MAG: hypothetical protein U0168_14875 [Nannocystaceae bacterium]